MSVDAVITEYLTENFLAKSGHRHVSPTDPLLDSGLIDSTGIFELVSFLEREFAIEVQDEEIVPDHFETIANIADFVRRKQQA